jgi:hypothetical protein
MPNGWSCAPPLSPTHSRWPLGDDGAENQTTVRRNDGSYGYTQAPTPGGGGEPPCVTALARAGGPRHYLGAASRCDDIRVGAALPLGAVPPFGSAFDAPVDSGAACASAYARVEEGGAYGPCHVLHGECRNAAEGLQCS